MDTLVRVDFSAFGGVTYCANAMYNIIQYIMSRTGLRRRHEQPQTKTIIATFEQSLTVYAPTASNCARTNRGPVPQHVFMVPPLPHTPSLSVTTSSLHRSACVYVPVRVGRYRFSFARTRYRCPPSTHTHSSVARLSRIY